MEPRHLGFIAEATGGELRHARPGKLVAGISTDSRSVERGALFFALVGERFDAHEFLTEAVGEAAGACVVEAARLGERLVGYPQIVVEDTRAALGRLAGRYRQLFDSAVIGVTGSNGKTSTKRFLNNVLSQRLHVCASPASFNNDVGVPLSLLQLNRSVQAAVFEVGTNHPGEIWHLTEMVRPRFGVITSIGRSHLEFFGSVEAVADEKGCLAEALPADGVLFVNGDIPVLDRILARVQARVVKVGFGKQNEWRIGDWSLDAKGMNFAMEAAALGGIRQFHLAALGCHHLINAGLALAAGAELGLSVEELEAGIAQCSAEKMRLEWGEFGGVTLIDDSYNANEDSTIAALNTLQAFPSKGARYCVLGDMGELGVFSAEAHSEVGRAAANCRVDHIISVGKWSRIIQQAARENGSQSAEAHADWEPVGESLKNQLKSGDTVLVKASRTARLDRLVKFLKQALATRKDNLKGAGNSPETPGTANRFSKANNSPIGTLNLTSRAPWQQPSIRQSFPSAGEHFQSGNRI